MKRLLVLILLVSSLVNFICENIIFKLPMIFQFAIMILCFVILTVLIIDLIKD